LATARGNVETKVLTGIEPAFNVPGKTDRCVSVAIQGNLGRNEGGIGRATVDLRRPVSIGGALRRAEPVVLRVFNPLA
jgi:hypothetical protein